MKIHFIGIGGIGISGLAQYMVPSGGTILYLMMIIVQSIPSIPQYLILLLLLNSISSLIKPPK